METQAEPRFKKRLPCRLRVAGNSHTAMVLNVSRSGLFVQTSAGPPPGASVSVDLDVANRSNTVPIGGKVIWRRMVSSHLRTISQGGIGIRIESAAEDYYGFLSDVAGGVPTTARPPAAEEAASSVPDTPEEPSGTPFRVRVKQQGGPRSRTLVIRGESEEEARKRALGVVGAGWVILELEPFS